MDSSLATKFKEIPFAGRYRFLEEIGNGSFARVYRAADLRDAREVAVKILKPHILKESKESAKRFQREIHTMSQLNHPHIVTVLDSDVHEGLVFAVFPYYANGSLRKRCGPVDEIPNTELKREDFLWVSQIATALDYLHRQGSLHRDVKPDNILLDGHGDAFLTDFGIVRAFEPDEAQSLMTNKGELMGTGPYMAPELIDFNTTTYTGGVDQYALATTLYEIIAGRRPFQGNLQQIILQQAQTTPTPLRKIRSDVPSGVSAAVARALEKRPDRRFASCAEFANAVAAALPGENPAAAKTAIQQRDAAPNRSRYLGAAILSMLLCVLSGAMIWLAMHLNSGAPEKDPKSTTVAAKSKKQKDAPKKKSLPNRDEIDKPPKKKSAGKAPKTKVKKQDDKKKVVKKPIPKKLPKPPPKKEPPKVKPKPKVLKPIVKPAKLIRIAAPTFKNEIGMEFVRVPHGSFWMSEDDANAATQVQMFHDYYIGVYEVTQEQWQTVMGDYPSYFAESGVGSEKIAKIPKDELKRFPVENVSWNKVQEFIKKLNDSQKDGKWLYRLPTNAEWEYACRGAAESKENCSHDFYFEKPSSTLSAAQANFDAANLGRTTKVGSYTANPLGIYDMHGNVWEWCQDWYAKDITRMMRGGGWYHTDVCCKAAFRFGRRPDYKAKDIGFRLVCVPADK